MGDTEGAAVLGEGCVTFETPTFASIGGVKEKAGC